VELHHRLGWVSCEWGGGGQIEVGEVAHNLEVVGCGEPPGPGSSASVGEEVHGEGGRMGFKLYLRRARLRRASGLVYYVEAFCAVYQAR